MSRHAIPMWDGKILTRNPNGWLDGSILTVDDYWKKGSASIALRQLAKPIMTLGHEQNWSIEQTQYALLQVLEIQRRGALPPNITSQGLLDIINKLLAEQHAELPGVILTAELLSTYGRTDDGALVRALAPPWLKIVELLRKDPSGIYELGARTLEELIAATYELDGFKVVLTPRSGDHGRDVIATKEGLYSIRIFDQVKAYKPDHRVDVTSVLALLGTLDAGNVSKAVMTTTSTFAPRLLEDPVIARNVPYRLQLRDRDSLLPWLDEVKRLSKR